MYLHPESAPLRRPGGTALLSPFDPLVWHRGRTERLFGFFYRIEIYTPAEKRVYGYYSLPILLGDAVVGRVDLKNDRQSRILRVQSAWSEADAPADIAERTAVLLRDAAAWQHLDDILRNGSRFAARWGEWPMTGWLEAFAEAGAVSWDGSTWRRDGTGRGVPARA